MSLIVDQTVQEVTNRTIIGVTGLSYTFFGLPFADLAAICTAVYMAFSALLLIPKLLEAIRNFRQKRNKDDEHVG